MKPPRLERAPESARPALVRPGENPALDAALARLRQKEAAPAYGAGAAAGVGAAAGAGPRRRPVSGWLLVGLSALAIAGTVIVMALAVLGSRRQAPAVATSAAPVAPVSAAAPIAAPPASSSAPATAASLAAPPPPVRAPSASPPAPPAPAPLPTRTMKPVDPALNE